jgi:hypothetical protein
MIPRDAAIWSITQESSITLLEVSFMLSEASFKSIYSAGHSVYDHNTYIAQVTGWLVSLFIASREKNENALFKKRKKNIWSLQKTF